MVYLVKRLLNRQTRSLAFDLLISFVADLFETTETTSVITKLQILQYNSDVRTNSSPWLLLIRGIIRGRLRINSRHVFRELKRDTAKRSNDAGCHVLSQPGRDFNAEAPLDLGFGRCSRYVSRVYVLPLGVFVIVRHDKSLSTTRDCDCRAAATCFGFLGTMLRVPARTCQTDSDDASSDDGSARVHSFAVI